MVSESAARRPLWHAYVKCIALPEAPVTAPRPPLPPFTRETAAAKVRAAEDAWNRRDPEKVSLAYSEDSAWRNRAEFLRGRPDIVAFLTRKWARELDYRLIKELWAYTDTRIAVRFAYEWRDDSGQWYRSYGNENWEFDEQRLHAPAHRLDQRPADRRRRAQVSLAGARPATGGASGPVRPRAVADRAADPLLRSRLVAADQNRARGGRGHLRCVRPDRRLGLHARR